jgi:hypothetical protein
MSKGMTWDDIDNWLAEHNHIALYFGTDDVLRIRPDLSEEQAWEVLQQCDLDDDEGCPIFYLVEAIAERLYGEALSDEPRNDEDDAILA